MADSNLARAAERAQQKRFLMHCLTDARQLAEVTTTLGIPPERLAQWLMQADFRRRMERLAGQLARLRETQLQLDSVRAAERLAALAAAEAADPSARGSAGSTARAACVDMIRLARAAPERPSRAGRPDPADADEAPRVHPELPATLRDQLVNKLSRGAATDRRAPHG